jgi:hypothetical protein
MSVTYPTPTLDRATLNFDPVADTDAVRKGYVTAATGAYLPLAGGVVSGAVTHQGTSALNGATTIGTATTAANFNVIGPAGASRAFQFMTGGSANANRRWQESANATAETGANAGSNRDTLAYDDTGTLLGTVLRATRATGSYTWNPNLTFTNAVYNFHGTSTAVQIDGTVSQAGTHTMTSGVAPGSGGLSPMGFNFNVNFAGTMDTGVGAPHFNYWQVNDTVFAARALTASAQLSMVHHYNAGASGDRWQLALTYNKSAAAADGLTTSAMNMFVAMQFDATEGIGTSSRASCVNFDCRVGGTGGHVGRLLNQENDIRLLAGNTADSKGNIVTNCGINDAAHGTFEDFAYAACSSPTIAPGTGGNKTVFQLCAVGTALPWDPTLSGTAIMDVYYNREANLSFGWNPTVYNGFNLIGLHFTNRLLTSTGLEIDGAGQFPVLGPAAISHSSTGTKISVPNVRAVSATVAAGGSGYILNEYLTDAMGNLWQVASRTGSAVATVTLIQTHYAAAAPTNPVATLSGNGTGCTLNLTTAATGSLNLSDTGQKLGFFGATAVVKPTVTGSKGANAALASLLTALANFGILTDSST